MKPLSLMSRGERMMMLALNRGVHEQAQGATVRGRQYGEIMHPPPARRRLQSCQEETCLNTGFLGRELSRNCQATCSTGDNCGDNIALKSPDTDEVCSLVNESAFRSGVLTSSSCLELNALDSTMQLDKTMSTTSVIVTPTVEVNDGPGTSQPIDTTDSADPDSNAEFNSNRKRKQTTNWRTKRRAEHTEEQTAAQQEKHSVKPGCNLTCKKNCTTKIPEEQRQQINREFWSMSHYERRCFMLHATKRKLASRKTTAADSRRKHSYFYFLNGKDGIKAVCKTFFLTTLGFQKNNDTALQNCLKSTALDSIKPGVDRRGKGPCATKIDRSLLTEHIESLNPAVSHYRREHAPQRRYLPSDVTIKTMHADFNSRPTHHVKCSYPVYRQTVHDMKISFVKLGQEECDKCEEFNLHDSHHKPDSLSDSCTVCQEWSKHMRRAREARQRYREDTEVDCSSRQRAVFSADLEKVVMLPRLDMFKKVLFTRRIIAFNESFVPLGNKQELTPLAVIWHEAIAGRKRDDICSAFHTFFTTYRDTPHILLWLDNCAAQNKNWGFLSYLVYLINSNETLTETVELNYLEPGHTFMSADSFHHRVELSMKQCVKNCSSRKVDVKSMTVSDFRDWADESSMYKINKLTPRPYLADIVWFLVERGKYSIDYKTEFNQSLVTTCNFLTAKACKHGIRNGVTRTVPRGIAVAKKEDIITKLRAVMPATRMKFWLDLPTAPVSDLTIEYD